MRRIQIIIFLILYTGSSYLYAQKYNDAFVRINKWRAEGQFAPAKKLLDSISGDAEKNNPEELVKIYTLYTKHFIVADSFEQAGSYAKKTMAEAQRIKSKRAMAYANYAMAYYFFQLEALHEAISYARAAETGISSEADADLEGYISYLLYCIYIQWDDFKNSDYYAGKTVENSIKAKNHELLANAYSAKGSAAGAGYKMLKKSAYKDSILYYHRKALATCMQNSASTSQHTYAIANLNLANEFYLALKENNTKAYADSVYKYLQNIAVLPAVYDYNNEITANALGMQAEIASKNGNLPQAVNYLQKAFQLLQQQKSRPAFYTLYNIAENLEMLYKKQGNYKKAAMYADEKLSYHQKLIDIAAVKHAKMVEAKYENTKIKAELSQSIEQNKQHQTRQLLLTVIVALACIALYATTKNFKTKMRYQQQVAKNLIEEKQNAETQLALQNEIKTRLMLEQELLKIQHEKAQKDAMVSALKLEHKNEIIETIKTQLSQATDTRKLQQALQKENRVEESLDNTKLEFENIHPYFFEKLKATAGDKLTHLDMRYCAYFFLGLSAKEIADIFNVAPKSIRMTKYRIKQKLQLPEEESLENFLQKMNNKAI